MGSAMVQCPGSTSATPNYIEVLVLTTKRQEPEGPRAIALVHDAFPKVDML